MADLVAATARLKAEFEANTAKAISEFDSEAVLKEIVADLTKVKRQVTWKLLGLENKWGKWEVDRCNGRTSPITEMLAAETRDGLSKFIQETAAKVVADLQRDDKYTERFRDAVMKELESNLEYQTRQAAANAAHLICNEVMMLEVNKIREELGLTPVTQLTQRR